MTVLWYILRPAVILCHPGVFPPRLWITCDDIWLRYAWRGLAQHLEYFQHLMSVRWMKSLIWEWEIIQDRLVSVEPKTWLNTVTTKNRVLGWKRRRLRVTSSPSPQSLRLAATGIFLVGTAAPTRPPSRRRHRHSRSASRLPALCRCSRSASRAV